LLVLARLHKIDTNWHGIYSSCVYELWYSPRKYDIVSYAY